MKIRTLVDILLPLCVLLVLSQHSNGLATRKCNDARLKVEIKKQASCLETVLNKYVKGGLKVYNDQKSKKTKVFDLAKVCQYHNQLWKRVETCNNKLVTKCFDSKLAQLANAFHSMFIPRTCNTITVLGMIDDSKIKNFQRLAERIVGQDPMTYFKSLVEFDKSCTTNQMADELGSINYPCVGGIMSTFYRQIGLYFHKGNATFPGNISSCKITASALKSCFNENECFSQNEMDLVRGGASIVYRWVMDTAVQITDNFGSVGNVDKALRATTLQLKDEYGIKESTLSEVLYEQAGRPWFDELMTKILKTADFVIKDFKNKECKNNLRGLPKLS